MTKVQQRTTALLAAFVLAAACAFVAGMPQQAYAKNTTLAAGTTFAKATNMELTGTTLKSTNKTEFNASYDNNFYKFTTSNRGNSNYRIGLKSYNTNGSIFLTVYDSSHHRIANLRARMGKLTTCTFQNLKPSSTYYVEVWRFITNTDDYISTNTMIDVRVGTSQFLQVPYKISIQEIIVVGDLSGFKVSSNSDHYLNAKWGIPPYEADGVQVEYWWSWQSKKTGNNTWTRGTAAENRKLSIKVKHFGYNKPYQVRARAYVTVNGKKYYGDWTSYKTVTVKPYSIENFKAAATKTSKQMKVSWAAGNKTDRVQIQLVRAWEKSSKKYNWYTDAKKGSYTIKTQYGGKAYTYKVRMRQSHVFNGSRTYGPWTSWKSLKVAA